MCQICNVVFTDTSSLGNHIQNVHAESQHSLGNSDATFSCHLCSVSLMTESDRDCHLQLEHGVTFAKPDISHNCQFCGRFFRHVSVLNMHSISCKKLLGNVEGPEEYSDYVTLDESIAFDDSESTDEKIGSLKRSVARRSAPISPGSLEKSRIESKVSKNKKSIHHGESENIPAQKRTRQSKDSAEKRVSCAYCIKSFSGKYEAIAHVSKSHQNKLEEFLVWLQRRKLYLKDKLCSICDKTFTSAQEATEHIQKCHKDGSKESFRCELCLIECSDELELLKHIANHSAPNGGSKVFIETKNSEADNASFSNVLAFSEFTPLSPHDASVGCENVTSCADVETSSSNSVQNTSVTCNVASVSNIIETCIYSNVSLAQNSMSSDAIIDSLLNDKEIIQFKTNSEGNPCYQANKNLESCTLDLPLLMDNGSTEKTNLVNSMTQLAHLSSTDSEIVDQRVSTPPS